ncbi:unnamed protein product [Effrenium voratum]|nr:unnamed protein product [Effrenium voratum]
MGRAEKETREKDKERKDKEREKSKDGKVKKDKPKDKKADDDSEDDKEKEKEKDKLAFLNALKGLRDKDKGKAKEKDRKKSSSSPSPPRKDRKTKRKREPSRSRDDSSGSATPPPPKKEVRELVTSSGFGAPLALTSNVVPAAVGASDVIGVFCRSAGADQNSEQALRALPPHLQQLVMAEGSIAGANPSAVLMGRIRKVENNASVLVSGCRSQGTGAGELQSMRG